MPMVDIIETDQDIAIKVELTELSQEEIVVSIEDGKLTISGERKMPPGLSPEQFHCNERPYGRFSRSFTLPQIIDDEKIRADYKQGVLTVTLPKQGKARPRQITINHR